MEHITTTLSELDYAMLLQYGVEVVSDEELEAEALVAHEALIESH